MTQLFLQLLPLAVQFALDCGVLPLPGPQLALDLLFFFLLLQEVRGEFQFAYASVVVRVRDANVHRGAKFGDGLPALVEPVDQRVQPVRTHGPYGVVGFGVVCAEHELGIVSDHLAALAF
jgi:hypothetical protein